MPDIEIKEKHPELMTIPVSSFSRIFFDLELRIWNWGCVGSINWIIHISFLYISERLAKISFQLNRVSQLKVFKC